MFNVLALLSLFAAITAQPRRYNALGVVAHEGVQPI
jgi:hypothetical protein